MVSHSSAIEREETPHVSNSTNRIISNALRRPALYVINNEFIDAQSRGLIRYGLEIDDPWLAELVRRAEAGESIVDNLDVAETDEHDRSQEKIEALADMICRAGDEPAVALLVLMAMLENATHPKALANTAKHLAFTHCAELNLHGMVDTQVAMLEGELLS